MLINYCINNILSKKKSLHQSLEYITHKYWVDEIGILRKINETMFDDCLSPAVLPSKLWHEVCKAYHASMHTEYWKYKCLYDAIAASYYFPGMAVIIKGYYHSCLNCAINSKSKTLTFELKPHLASYPGIVIHLDCTKGPKYTSYRNTHILAIVDNFSNYL